MDEHSPFRLRRLAHEIKTPLAAAAGYAELMAQSRLGHLSSAYVERARLVLSGVRHALALVESLADAEAGMDPRPLAEVASEVVGALEAMATEARVEITVEFASGAALAPVPARAAQQMLTNLLHNALKATGPGGSVALSAAAAEDVHIIVTDTGGRRPEAGAGLGLDIVRALAAGMGGEFEFATTPAGSRAALRLPRAAGP